MRTGTALWWWVALSVPLTRSVLAAPYCSVRLLLLLLLLVGVSGLPLEIRAGRTACRGKLAAEEAR